ncbi:hypothetical protein EVAR_56086_1 [Eumeta japonica]|uniref:Uncharacterized protein n=1 Tax=Eumeta variegata TaxID=151549 RepID=A0A4C1YT24_EUMVA|nr:hypothetical protein EVAR_56086_1 [Eumeta japonica]
MQVNVTSIPPRMRGEIEVTCPRYAARRTGVRCPTRCSSWRLSENLCQNCFILFINDSLFNISEKQSMQATRELVITAAHGHSQPQKSGRESSAAASPPHRSSAGGLRLKVKVPTLTLNMLKEVSAILIDGCGQRTKCTRSCTFLVHPSRIPQPTPFKMPETRSKTAQQSSNATINSNPAQGPQRDLPPPPPPPPPPMTTTTTTTTESNNTDRTTTTDTSTENRAKHHKHDRRAGPGRTNRLRGRSTTVGEKEVNM